MRNRSTPDLVLLAGDLGQDPPWDRALRRSRRAAHDDSVREIVGDVARICGCPVAFVPGNHDLRDVVEDLDGTNVDGCAVELAGLRVVGLGGAGPSKFGFAYEWSEEQAALALDRTFAGASGRVDVFLSHTPPLGTLDRTQRGVSVGSAAVRRFVVESRPRLFVCGHIHEAWGVDRLEGVPCINAGAYGEPYPQEIVWAVDWLDGPTRIASYRREADGSVNEKSWSV